MPRVGRAFQLIGTSSNPWFYGNTKPWTLCAQACGATDASTRPSAELVDADDAGPSDTFDRAEEATESIDELWPVAATRRR